MLEPNRPRFNDITPFHEFQNVRNKIHLDRICSRGRRVLATPVLPGSATRYPKAGGYMPRLVQEGSGLAPALLDLCLTSA
ncbi:hypothetical protein Trisim1_005000 [Trichoderma cf. simile WF8]